MSKPRLLLADDSITIQKLVNLTFTDEGFEVFTVGDGESALREIGAAPPDIVLADVHMPGPDGYEICKLMRSVEETSVIPVILLAGSFEPFDNEKAGEVGANSFITKPFQSIRSLVDEVNGLLSAATTTQVPEAVAPETQEPKAEAVGVSDIDSLYSQSFAETVEMPAEMATALYTADKLDDEMIETSYTPIGETGPLGLADNQGDVENFQRGADASPNEPVAESGQRPIDESFEHVYDDLPQGVDEGPGPTIAEVQGAPTEEFRHEARDPFATTADDFDFDEVDLLDLTPASMKQTVEFTTPGGAAEQGSRSQVVSLSPALLDIIVQRVIEKLSEKY